VKALDDDHATCIPGTSQMKSEQLEISQRSVRSSRSKAERDILPKGGLLSEGSDGKFGSLRSTEGIWPADWLCAARGSDGVGFYELTRRAVNAAGPKEELERSFVPAPGQRTGPMAQAGVARP